MQAHGTRVCYTSGCRCAPCRRANAQYFVEWRQKKRHGTIILGAVRSSTDAQRLLEKLYREHVTKSRINHELGLRSTQLKVRPRITVRKHLRIQRVYQRFMAGGELPRG